MLERALTWIRSLSPLWLGVLVLVGTSGFVGASLAAYRTYDYIEHDNDFCMSCHLMAEPFERFARSSHRDLGCKACHKPSFAARSQMGLTQIIENPEEITVHAEVPNEKCASCHIEGDPDEWRRIENTVGHRVHLESDDPDLEGLLCVQCHSSGVHEFAATDDTCAQSGCHTDVEVNLGRMSDFAIHCAACHTFQAPSDPELEGEELVAALAPGQNECMSCHAMRTLVEMPPEEPHEQNCATCHNPHDQTTPAEAGSTCATVGCHNDVTDLSPFHRGLDHLAVQDCLSCHTAHGWEADGNDCLSCHVDIYEDEPAARVPGGQVAWQEVPAGVHTFLGAGFPGDPPAPGVHVLSGIASRGPAPVQAADTVQFRHSQHQDVDCAQCHVSSEQHGQVIIDSLVDCRGCHHTEPESANCAECHAGATFQQTSLVARDWAMEFSTAQRAVRDIPFLHGDHQDAECATCHTDGLTQPMDVASCNTCHQEHHEAAETATCITCHSTPLEDAHTVDSHLTCSGAGCHESPPLQVVPRTRNGCLVCHQDLTDHEPSGECTDCHALPSPVGGGRP